MAYINGNQLKVLWEIAWNNADNGNSVSDICSELESILRGLGNTGDNKLRTKDARIAIDTMTIDNDLVIVTNNFNISSIDNRSFTHTQRGTQSIDRHSLFAESSVLPLISYDQARALFYDDYRAQHDTERELFNTYHACYGESTEELYWHMGCIFSRLADLYYAAYYNLEITRGRQTTYARSNILLD